MEKQDEFIKIFSSMPKELRENLEKYFLEIIKNYKENRWEPSELNGAKFSEVVFRILEWHTNNSYTPFGTKIQPFNDKLKQFENKTNFSNSIKFHIPKMLAVIYSLRNDRGVSHVGGDVNPNHMDSVAIVYISKWILAEIIRIVHTLSISDAHGLVEKIVEKEIPIVWTIFNKKRVLNINLNFEDKTLVLLYSEYPKEINEKNLCTWVEHSNSSIYKNIIKKLHKEKFIEYDKESSSVIISPKGIKRVEQEIDFMF
ncbi:hypothetical protein J4436_04460 [Candidatus Woesearchaeota archaeon]|nr:hypothetical protein [Candidatus Woesearchaeota archaeon]